MLASVGHHRPGPMALALVLALLLHAAAAVWLLDRWRPEPPEVAVMPPLRLTLVSAPAPAAEVAEVPLPPPAAPVAAAPEPEVLPESPAQAQPSQPPAPGPTRSAPPPRRVVAAEPVPRPKPVARNAAVPRTRAAVPDEPAPVAVAQPVERPAPPPSAPPTPRLQAPSLDGLSNPEPRYPLAARRRGLEGLVLLALQVDADGRVTAVEVKRSSGHELLDRAASRAVARWRFRPALLDDRPVAAGIEVPVRFRLTGD